MKRTIILVVVVVAALLLYSNRSVVREFIFQAQKPQVPAAISYNAAEHSNSNNESDAAVPVSTSTKPTVNPAPTAKPIEKPVPAEINLAVPFRSQAPFGDWSEPYQNACEEASLIMVDYYLRGAILSAQQMKDGIDAQVAWQIKNWGGHEDLPIAKVKELATAFYPSYTVKIISDLTIDKIKEQLRFGRPVIVPTAGRELRNPNFTAPGPIYHMLVIKGYTTDGRFITNDPGTRKGADYVYSPTILMNAIHDWTGKAPDGQVIGLVMYK